MVLVALPETVIAPIGLAERVKVHAVLAETKSLLY